jgi:hypothetical protein
MKAGTLVKVVACITGHDFEIGETVVRHRAEHDDLDLGSLGFIDETGSIWYMSPEEYEVL